MADLDPPDKAALVLEHQRVARAVRVRQLSVWEQFDALSPTEQLYAHRLCQAAWHGARIVLRQASFEALGIFSFILELYRVCGGDWDVFVRNGTLYQDELEAWVLYAARFLSNLGNYHGRERTKFVPLMPAAALDRLANGSMLFEMVKGRMCSRDTEPRPDQENFTPEEVTAVSRVLWEARIRPENIRLQKGPDSLYTVYFPSVTGGRVSSIDLYVPERDATLRILRGDYGAELARVRACIEQSIPVSSGGAAQAVYLAKLSESLDSGSPEAYNESQRAWVRDHEPGVESNFGFVEQPRDPNSIRDEFCAMVAIPDKNESRIMALLVENSAHVIRKLPWANPDAVVLNEGKGHFEPAKFSPPVFRQVHILAYCTSAYHYGISQPKHEDLRKEAGFKKFIVTNMLSNSGQPLLPSPFLDDSEQEIYCRANGRAAPIHLLLHELYGHAEGKLMQEGEEEEGPLFNFDVRDPPINPLTGQPITSWYRAGETAHDRFADMTGAIFECRADLLALYLLHDPEMLGLFGYTEETECSATDVLCALYQRVAVHGLQSLRDYCPQTKTWGDNPHTRSHWATLTALCRAGVIAIAHDALADTVRARVDAARILSHGRPAVSDMLLRLHIYLCTGDGDAAREYFGDMSRVDWEHEAWRGAVVARDLTEWLYVQANTFESNGRVHLRKYPATPRGIIQSWAERVSFM